MSCTTMVQQSYQPPSIGPTPPRSVGKRQEQIAAQLYNMLSSEVHEEFHPPPPKHEYKSTTQNDFNKGINYCSIFTLFNFSTFSLHYRFHSNSYTTNNSKFATHPHSDTTHTHHTHTHTQSPHTPHTEPTPHMPTHTHTCPHHTHTHAHTTHTTHTHDHTTHTHRATTCTRNLQLHTGPTILGLQRECHRSKYRVHPFTRTAHSAHQ